MGLIPFKLEHIKNMDIKADALTAMAHEDMAESLRQLEKTGNAMTFISEKDNVILGVLGFVPRAPGVCEVFIVATEDQKRHPIEFAKTVKKELFNLLSKFRRIQVIATEDAFHKRWLSWLGFKKEGVLKKFGVEGEDLGMWGLTQ